MTDHADISRRLALAIGWREDQLYNEGDGSFCSINISDTRFIEAWRDFDYRDFAVIWPIAERLDFFPVKTWGSTDWCVERWEPIYQFTQADTAALAVALAVIKAKESK